MKAKGLFLAVAIAGSLMIAKTQTVYVAGYVDNENGNGVAKVWKDGSELYVLTDGKQDASAQSIYILGNDIYVAGYEKNTNGNYTAKVWKNGVELYALTNTTQDSYANSIYVTGNDIYVAGNIKSSNGTRTAKVWKNDMELYSLTSDGDATKICVSNNDVYVCGYSNSNGIVWKNGTIYWTTDVTGYSASAQDISISNGNVYVSMNYTTKTIAIIAKIDQGTAFSSLFTYGNFSNPSSSAYANSFAVSGSDVYAAVNTMQNYLFSTWVYKNNNYLFSLSGDEVMYLFNSDIYLTGRTTQGALKVWKNETELYVLADGASYGWATDIFVIPSSGNSINKLTEINFSISPSPATDFVTLSGLQPNEMFYIYNVNGQQLFSRKAASETETVSISNLPSGIYLLKVDNGQIIKWIKR